MESCDGCVRQPHSAHLSAICDVCKGEGYIYYSKVGEDEP